MMEPNSTVQLTRKKPMPTTRRLQLFACTLAVLSGACVHQKPVATAASLPPPLPSREAAVVAGLPAARALSQAPVNPNPQAPSPRPDASCHSRGDLQDSACTPGVVSPLVTQANIKSTICVSGYTEMIRRQFAPVSYTDALKAQQISEYGYADTKLADYEEDHLVSLELGGHPNDPRNLWPEFPHSPNPKDSVEGKLKRLICSGKVELIDAQLAIATNWKTALKTVQKKP